MDPARRVCSPESERTEGPAQGRLLHEEESRSTPWEMLARALLVDTSAFIAAELDVAPRRDLLSARRRCAGRARRMHVPARKEVSFVAVGHRSPPAVGGHVG